jgi:hypothetical protein
MSEGSSVSGMVHSDQPGDLTRRELLRRGALLGAAVAWTTPMVQLVGMSPADAKTPSPGCLRYALKWEADDNLPAPGDFTCAEAPEGAQELWGSSWVAMGNPPPDNANCLPTPGSPAINSDSAASDLGSTFKVYGSRDTGFWVAFPNTCSVADLTDESSNYSAAAKCGSDGCNELTKPQTGEEPDPCFEGFTRISIGSCPTTDSDISHLELIIDCCD